MRIISKIVFVLCVLSGASAIAQDKAKDGEVEKTDVVETEAKKAVKGSKTKEADEKEKAAKKKVKDSKKDGAKKEGEAVGPGGKPLRMDYPGTEESKTSVMTTSQIKGLETLKAGDTSYGLRVKELETKIDDLKEKVFQSKTRIVLLREKLLSGNLAGSKAMVIHKTELGSAWSLTQAIYNLDGTRVFAQTDENGSLADKDSFEVYDGGLSPGNHKVTVFLKYQGTSMGIFPYFKGYGGDIRAVCDIVAKEGKISRVEVAIFPKGGIAESIEKRPNVRCDVTYIDNIIKDEKPSNKPTNSVQK